jgi:hypothetical protein
MDARILRIELRRSVALWAGLLIAAVGIFVLFTSNPPYRSWLELAVYQRDIMALTWPLALGAGAWQGIRERRSRVEELLASTPRPRRRRVLPVAAAMAIAAVAAHLVMLAGASGHLWNFEVYLSSGTVPIIATGALAMIAGVWLGQALGSLLPSPLTPPMLVVAAFVSLAVLPPLLWNPHRMPGTVLLSPQLRGPRGGGFLVQTLSERANLSQALWLAALAATGLALFAAARPATRAAAVAVPILIGAAIAVPVMPRLIDSAWVTDHAAAEIICTRGDPQICIARSYSYALDHLRDPAREALATLAAKLPRAPSRVLVEAGDKPSLSRPPASTILLVAADPTAYKREDLLWRMLDGAGVPACPNLIGNLDRPNQRYVAARSVAAAWLLDSNPPPASGRRQPSAVAMERQALAALRALPASVQKARVTAFRDAELTCARGDRLRLLTAPRTAP